MKLTPVLITGIFAVTTCFAAYSVKKGDSLSLIAKELYGDLTKWPEIHKLNSKIIKNPNLIFPKQVLRFPVDVPGKDRLLVASNAKSISKLGKLRSQEWRLLPEQSWEKFVFRVTPEVDPEGFDRRSKVTKRVAEKTTPTITVASDRIAVEGEIINARTEYGQVFLGEQIFIRAEEQLQLGTVYSISSPPQKIVSERDSRVGFAYDLAGKVKIIGVRDGLFIGTVITSQRPIHRNDLLIPEVKPLIFPKAIPSVNVIPASVLTTEFLNTSMLAEQQLVVLDAGTDDGVKTGMIFRNYLKNDPLTGKAITSKDYLIEAELQVLDVKDQFSIAIILRSRSVIHANDMVVSLMDLRDFQKNAGMQTFIQDADTAQAVDVLDQLDDSQGLGVKEDKELRQLEKVDPNKLTLPPALGDEEAPNDQKDKTIYNGKPPVKAVPKPEEKDAELDDAELDAPPKTESTPTPAPTPSPTPTPIPTPVAKENDKTSSDNSVMEGTKTPPDPNEIPPDLLVP